MRRAPGRGARRRLRVAAAARRRRRRGGGAELPRRRRELDALLVVHRRRLGVRQGGASRTALRARRRGGGHRVRRRPSRHGERRVAGAALGKARLCDAGGAGVVARPGGDVDAAPVDATKLGAFPFSHVYMYDKVFSDPTTEMLAAQLKREREDEGDGLVPAPSVGNAWALRAVRGGGVAHDAHDGGQNFKAYVFVRAG